MPTLLHPNSEAVAVAWLSGLLPVGVATTLPKLASWPVYSGTVKGFATVSIVGGRTFDTGLRMPVVSVGTWAAVEGSDNPQWQAAMQLAELVLVPAFALFESVTVRPSVKYDLARVQSVRLNAEPRRVPDPDASMAHIETELILAWTEVPS